MVPPLDRVSVRRRQGCEGSTRSATLWSRSSKNVQSASLKSEAVPSHRLAGTGALVAGVAGSPHKLSVLADEVPEVLMNCGSPRRGVWAGGLGMPSRATWASAVMPCWSCRPSRSPQVHPTLRISCEGRDLLGPLTMTARPRDAPTTTSRPASNRPSSAASACSTASPSSPHGPGASQPGTTPDRTPDSRFPRRLRDPGGHGTARYSS